MLERMVNFFVSGFVYPGILWSQVLLGIGMGIAFGTIWFMAYWSPVLKKPRIWSILAGSAFLSWAAVQTDGLIMLAGFWERFFAVAFHIAASALAGWGLAKGWGWQFYLLASLLHALLNYSSVLYHSGVFTVKITEIYIAVVAVLVSGVAIWLRWRKSEAAV